MTQPRARVDLYAAIRRDIGDRVTAAGGSAEPPYPGRVPNVPAVCVKAESELFITNGG
jgi:hypothetical protein